MSTPNAFTTQHDVNLTGLNTMRLSCVADTVVTVHDPASTEMAIAHTKAIGRRRGLPLFVLSGGSNVILPKQLAACVLILNTYGIRLAQQTSKYVDIVVHAGVGWHDLVVHTVTQGWYGLENLALIPGNVGASPVQNIGAYGAELADCLLSVTAYHLPTNKWHTLTKQACEFAYRDSLFKRQAGEWLITEVAFRLHKDDAHITADYAQVKTQAIKIAECDGRARPSPRDVMHAIIDIRSAKLPDPDILPNCGSFFKNPVIATTQFNALRSKFPDIVGYRVDDTHTKVAGGWLIEHAGLKGGGIDPIKTHQKQALVLVNHAADDTHANQADIFATQTVIQDAVHARFGIRLEREPVWVT